MHELLECYILGTVYNHPDPELEDGTSIKTAGIVKIIDNKVTTEAGITYYLLHPDKSYVEFLKESGQEDHINDMTRVNNN